MTEGNAAARFEEDQVLPSCDILRETGADPSRPVCDCLHRVESRDQWLNVTAAQLRCVESAFDGDDGPDTMWSVNREVRDTPWSDQWQKIFMDEGLCRHRGGLPAGAPLGDH